MTVRPRLLFIAPWFLFPIDSGGKIRTTDILRAMKGGAFDITLVSPAPEYADEYQEGLQSICDRFVGWPESERGPLFPYTRLRHIVSRLPIPVATDVNADAKRVIAAELEKQPDVVVYDFVHAAVLHPLPEDIPTVVFTHNVEAEIFARHARVAGDPLRRWVWNNQYRKMKRFEGESLQAFDRVIAVAGRDAAQFKSDYGIAEPDVIPTGVNLDFYKYQAPPVGDGRTSPGTIVITASMNSAANIDGLQFFMDDVWPLIDEQRPGTKMVVVGRNPDAGLVANAEKRGLPWTFTGFVDDVRPLVHDAHVYVIPLRVGGGTRLKVFEAMAMGSPVVSTTIGVEGLPVEDGAHYLNADDPKAFAGATVRLLDDEGLRNQVSQSARAFVEAEFSSQRVGQVFENICKKAAGVA